MKIRVIVALSIMLAQIGIVSNSFSKTTRGKNTPNTRLGRYGKLAERGDINKTAEWQKQEYGLLQRQAAGEDVSNELAALAQEHPEEGLLQELYANATPEEIKQMDAILEQASTEAEKDEADTKKNVIEAYKKQLNLRCDAIKQQIKEFDCSAGISNAIDKITANVNNDMMDNDAILDETFTSMIDKSTANEAIAKAALTKLQNDMVAEEKKQFLQVAQSKLESLKTQLNKATEQEEKDLINEEINKMQEEINKMNKATTWAQWTKAKASAAIEIAQAHYIVTALGILAIAATGVELSTGQISEVIKSSALLGTLTNYATECGISAMEACKTGWATATSYFKQMIGR